MTHAVSIPVFHKKVVSVTPKEDVPSAVRRIKHVAAQMTAALDLDSRAKKSHLPQVHEKAVASQQKYPSVTLNVVQMELGDRQVDAAMKFRLLRQKIAQYSLVYATSLKWKDAVHASAGRVNRSDHRFRHSPMHL